MKSSNFEQDENELSRLFGPHASLDRLDPGEKALLDHIFSARGEPLKQPRAVETREEGDRK